MLKKPFVIAITGGSGAGKSAVAASVAHALGDCALLHPDDYYNPLPDGVSAWDDNFDQPGRAGR
jgi:uridine kinase